MQPLRGECMGSSPRARGAQFGNALGVAPVGIIPACAGSTSPADRSPPGARDHPRVRGEHGRGRVLHVRAPGSSPRARGAPSHARAGARARGIIPACAGSTRRRPELGGWSWDHPRVRGEHAGSVRTIDMPPGSSPRARGAPTRRLRGASVAGIIPACAGSTPTRRGACGGGWDHPRVRGEHDATRSAWPASSGSSPRARGAPVLVEADLGGSGIIPACAGSTVCARVGGRSGRDHPRVRGEHLRSGETCTPNAGSSPRARGALDPAALERADAGIIPACAGSTRSGGSPIADPRDHPRVRGEHSRFPSTSPPSTGSSPRARGAPPRTR